MLDEPDGRVIAYFCVLRIRHAELDTEFDIMLRMDTETLEVLLARLRESARTYE